MPLALGSRARGSEGEFMSKRRIAIYIVALIAVFGLCVGLADFKKVREKTRRQTISGTDAGQTV